MGKKYPQTVFLRGLIEYFAASVNTTNAPFFRFIVVSSSMWFKIGKFEREKETQSQNLINH